MSSEEKQFNKMTESPICRLIASLSLPAVISMLITSVYNMADTFFVSKLGTSASAAVGVVFALMSIIQAVGFTLGMGSGSNISRALGEKNEKKASVYASSAVAAAVVFGFILAVFGLIFLKPLMRCLGSTESILPYSMDYAKYILLGAPVMCTMFVLNNVLRAQGKVTLSMICVMVGGILNMFIDPLFIFTFDLGISGAAIATLISQFISCAMLLFIYLSGKSIVKITFKRISHQPKVYLSIIKIGLPTLCRQGIASIASALLALKAGIYGDAAIAAMTIATKLYMFVRSIVLGIGQGFQPVAGYNYGAKKFARVKKGFWFTTLLGTIVCVVFSVGFALIPEQMIALFRDDTEVIAIGKRALIYYCAVLPVLGFSTYVNQLLQCLGRSKSATFLASCRQGIFYIPLIFILSHFMGLAGIELTQPLADLSTFLISIPFLMTFFKAMKKMQE